MSETSGDFVITGDEILYEVSDRIATITLNRPDRMNALNSTMPYSLAAAMKKAVEDTNVRVILLTGAGRGFCAGADMARLEESGKGGPRRTYPAEPLSFFAAIDSGVGPELGLNFRRVRSFAYLIRIGKPIIAALNGPCAGIGVVLAACCDVRFASENFMFTTSFGQRARIAEHGISWLLPRLIGHGNATDVILSSRKVRAQEAKEMGFVSKVFPADKLMDEARAYAKILANDVSPNSTAIMKAQLWKSTFETFADSALEADLQTEIIAKHPDYKEGAAHFVEKRPARFADFKRGWRSST